MRRQWYRWSTNTQSDNTTGHQTSKEVYRNTWISMILVEIWLSMTTLRIHIHMYSFWEWISSMWNITGILKCSLGPTSSLFHQTEIRHGWYVTQQPDMIWTKCKRYPPCILTYNQTQCHSEVHITRYALAPYLNGQSSLYASSKHIWTRSTIIQMIDNDYLEHAQVESICSER
jgi:hypothetical protein